MPEKFDVKEVLPDPKRVIEGLRDTGYQFDTAVADIIDNSIGAEASVIDVRIEMDFEGNISVQIMDNGIGMDREELIGAMRYGSPKRPDPASLGKFGLGMKTASTAFCRRLSVISRNGKSCPLTKATWDLDHVSNVGKWELQLGSPTEDEAALLDKMTPDSSGTLVIWDKIDRLLKSYQDPGGHYAQKALEKHIQKLRDHVSLVYQRFLDPSDERARFIELKINGKPIKAYNPFCPQESELVGDQVVKVSINGGSEAEFSLKAYVLPRKEEFENTDGHKKYRLTNENQGVYVYRENRLIHGPDWLGMFRKEPHFTLSRIEFSFDHRLDDAFHIDIKKSQILLNEDLYNFLLNEFILVPRRAAEQRYRKGQRRTSTEAAESAHDSSNKNIHSKADNLRTVSVESAADGEATITNRFGTTLLKISVRDPRKPGEVHIQPVESINDGLLWEPSIIGGNQGVSINTGHPYYNKVYVTNRQSGVIIQGLDSLIWALGSAELGTVNEATKKHFEEMRYEVSRLLRTLVEDLPDPEIEITEE